jgi:hypothetical protein
MRSLILSLILVAGSPLFGQEVTRYDFSQKAPRRPYRVRLDVGIGAGGCQGSFIPEVDWSLATNGRPHKPERRSFWPSFYIELEVRPCERLGLTAYRSAWFNERHIEDGNHYYGYSSQANTTLIGGRWYWDWNTPRMEWYSGAMGGWSHNWKSGTPALNLPPDANYFAHQLTFIGFRSKHTLSWSVELGQGYKGFLSFGASLAF